MGNVKQTAADLLKSLLISYFITGVLLLLLAFLLYKVRLSETIVNGGVILIYAVSVFMAGLFMGKKRQVKRYLWGLLVGICYFALLAGVSVISGGFQSAQGGFFTAFLICAAGGMLGGMVS